MLVTRENDYSIRIVRALSGMNKLTVNQICEQEQIPLPFAYKILKKLSQKDLVSVIRGAGGGYKLAKTPAEITLLDIMLAIEDELVLNKCQEYGYRCEYVECTGNVCKVYRELNRILKILEAELKSKTLQEIFEAD